MPRARSAPPGIFPGDRVDAECLQQCKDSSNAGCSTSDDCDSSLTHSKPFTNGNRNAYPDPFINPDQYVFADSN